MKTAAILVQGPSLKELEERIAEFKDKDWVWAAVNQYRYMERHILEKIDKQFDIVYCICSTRFNQIASYLIGFNGLLISEDPFYCRINSLCGLIHWLERAGYKKIILFGADGGVDEGDTYYRQDEFKFNLKAERVEVKNKAIQKDTVQMNKEFNIGKVTVLNCSKRSKINIFPKITIDEALNES